MLSGKLSSWQEHWLKDQFRFPVLLHWSMWIHGTPGHGVTCCSRNSFVIKNPWVRCSEDPVIWDPPVRRRHWHLRHVLLLWIVDTVSKPLTFVMEYALYETVKNPMEQWVNYQAKPPGFIIDNTSGSTNRRASRRWRLQLLRKYLHCVNHIFWVNFMFQKIVVL